MTTTRTLLCILVCVWLNAGQASAASFVRELGTMPADAETVFATGITPGGCTQTYFQLGRFEDLNLDGDFSDTGEVTAVWTGHSTTGCDSGQPCQVAGSPMSCGATTGGTPNLQNYGHIYTWRNNTAGHGPGNYSAALSYNGVGNTSIDTYVWVFRLVPSVRTEMGSVEARLNTTVAARNTDYLDAHLNFTESRLNATIIGQAQQTRTLVNATNLSLIDQHQQTRILINTTHAGGGCDSSCQENITDTVRQQSISLTDYLAPDLTLASAIMVLLWLAAFLWCARQQWFLPAAIAFAGMLLPLVVSPVALAMKGAFLVWLVGLILEWAADRFNFRRDGATR